MQGVRASWLAKERVLLRRDLTAASRWFLRHRGLLDVAVAVVGVLAVGLTSLVIEDALQLTDTDAIRPAPVFDGPRVVLWLFSSVALISVVWYRSRLAHAKGTLYYVRFLQEWMPDWHVSEEGERRRGHLDGRVVSRHMMTASHDGVVDTAAEVHEISIALQTTMNDDDVGTGFTLAPNLLWPAAVALGYQAYLWPGTLLTELDSAVPLEWSMHAAPAPGAEFHRPECRTTGEILPDEVRTVLLRVDLTGKGASTVPAGRPMDVSMRVAVFAAPGKAADDPSEATQISTVTRRGARVVHPMHAAETVITTIRQALCRYPDAIIYTILRVPKTVAFAVGAGLTGAGSDPFGDQCAATCRTHACRYPWRRLVPLMFDQERSGNGATQYVAMRVAPGQPPAAELAAQARRHGLTLSGVTTAEAAEFDAAPEGTAL